VSTKKPNGMFRNFNPGASVIKGYCFETAKRIKYHLKAGNADMVKYLIANLEKLYEVL
jgi:hypothetical protein